MGASTFLEDAQTRNTSTLNLSFTTTATLFTTIWHSIDVLMDERYYILLRNAVRDMRSAVMNERRSAWPSTGTERIRLAWKLTIYVRIRLTLSDRYGRTIRKRFRPEFRPNKGRRGTYFHKLVPSTLLSTLRVSWFLIEPQKYCRKQLILHF